MESDEEPGKVKTTFRGVTMRGGEKVNVSPSHAVALRPGTRYRIAGMIMMTQQGRHLSIELGGRRLGEELVLTKMSGSENWSCEFTTGAGERWLAPLTLQLTTGGTLFNLSLREVGGGPELLWEANPNRPERGDYNPLDCFLLDQVVEAAERSGIKLQLCLLSRDLYMNALKKPDSAEYDQAILDAKKTLRYAVARWGYSTAVAAWEYWNEENPGLPTDRFYAEEGKYLKEIDPYQHLRVTSAWGPAEKDWRHGELDAADLHHYLRSTWGPRWRDEVAAVAERAEFLLARAPGRPARLSEFGLADDKWGLSPHMREDKDLGHFHNALWASALSGFIGDGDVLVVGVAGPPGRVPALQRGGGVRGRYPVRDGKAGEGGGEGVGRARARGGFANTRARRPVARQRRSDLGAARAGWERGGGGKRGDPGGGWIGAGGLSSAVVGYGGGEGDRGSEGACERGCTPEMRRAAVYDGYCVQDRAIEIKGSARRRDPR